MNTKKFFQQIQQALILGVLFFFSSAVAVHAAKPSNVTVERPKNHVIRVLLAQAPQPAVFTSDGQFVVETDTNTILKVFDAGKQVSITVEGAEYVLRYGENFSKEIRSTESLQVTPVSMQNLVEAVNFSNSSSWESTDNLFYHTVRVVKDSTGVPVLVNALGIERYTEGLCESGATNVPEYTKALLTAARTYALYHTVHHSKYPNEPYDIDSTSKSQIYCGAEFTLRTPQVRAARKATKKHVVFYNGQMVLTPYFSRSDGRTRAWREVWSGDPGYLQSVDDPCCHGGSLWGHGVGMSGTGARYFAAQGWTWKQILQYYYTGTEIKPFQ